MRMAPAFFSIHDLHMFINNIEGRRSKAKKLTLPSDEGDVTKQVLVGGVMYPCALKLVEWNENSLREALQVMFIEAGVAPLDMLRAFDYDGSGALRKQEFLVMLKKIVNDNELWDQTLRGRDASFQRSPRATRA